MNEPSTTEFGESVEISKSPCKEILEFVDGNNIPLSDEFRDYLSGNRNSTGRYGNEFTLASGMLVRSICREKGDLDRWEVFGINRDVLESRAEMMLRHEEGFNDMLFDEQTNKIEIKVAEIAVNPVSIFPGLEQLNHLEDVDLSKGAKIFLDLMRQAIFSTEDVGGYEFGRDHSITYDVCKDTEFYFVARLNDVVKTNDAAVTIFTDGDNPIFVQKTGGYKTDLYVHNNLIETNATAINLVPVRVNDIVYPPGTLFGLNTSMGVNYVKRGGDQCYSINTLTGVMPLRLTLFSIPENEQELAFGTHYRDAVKNTTHEQGKRYNGVLPVIDDFRKRAEGVISKFRN